MRPIASQRDRAPEPRISEHTPKRRERDVLGLAETSPADVAHVYAGGTTSRIVDGLHGLGLKAHANDAANSDEIKRAIDAGADSLSANDVETSVALCRAANA